MCAKPILQPIALRISRAIVDRHLHLDGRRRCGRRVERRERVLAPYVYRAAIRVHLCKDPRCDKESCGRKERREP